MPHNCDACPGREARLCPACQNVVHVPPGFGAITCANGHAPLVVA